MLFARVGVMRAVSVSNVASIAVIGSPTEGLDPPVRDTVCSGCGDCPDNEVVRQIVLGGLSHVRD